MGHAYFDVFFLMPRRSWTLIWSSNRFEGPVGRVSRSIWVGHDLMRPGDAAHGTVGVSVEQCGM